MRGTLRWWAAMGMCVVVAGGVAACGSDDDSGTSASTGAATAASTQAGGDTSEKSGPENVAFLDESITSLTKPMLAGVQDAADAAGVKLDHFSADHDPQKQLQQCQDALATGKYQALLIYATDGAAMQACAKQAISDGLTVVPVNQVIGPDAASTDIQVDGIKVQVVNSLQDDVAATVELVDKACADKPKPCKIVKTVAVPPYFYSSYKLKNEVPIYKDKGYEVVATPVIGNFDDPDGMKSAINDVLSRTQDIDVIVSDDDSSVQGAVQMRRDGDLPKDVAIIGDGGNAAALKSVQDGDQFGTVYNVPKTMGTRAFEELVKAYRGEPIEKPTLTYKDLTPSIVVTTDNSQDLQAEW